ncbi:hypothetical protein HDU91_005397 [Kappamyces sp. JEL0680]|nr:hypothetical protein HDU91_005397 [Kappamyces sp. JEL0680]
MLSDGWTGTGAVILAGFEKAVALSKIPAHEHRIVFYGAGSAAVGVARMLSEWIQSTRPGMTEQEAKERIFLCDTKGLISESRGDKLPEHKLYFSRHDIDKNDLAQVKSLDGILDYVRPTALIGLCTVGGVFTDDILKKMAAMNDKPIVMPLSNPSSNAECTFEQAMTCTEGRVIFASGSPFPAMTFQGKTYIPGQGNNMYIFPGLGMGSILTSATRVTEGMILAAATALANEVSPSESAQGLIYPKLERIRDVSLHVIVAVMKQAVKDGVGKLPCEEKNLISFALSKMYDPYYSTKL